MEEMRRTHSLDMTDAAGREKRWTWVAVLAWLAATNILVWFLYH